MLFTGVGLDTHLSALIYNLCLFCTYLFAYIPDVGQLSLPEKQFVYKLKVAVKIGTELKGWSHHQNDNKNSELV